MTRFVDAEVIGAVLLKVFLGAVIVFLIGIGALLYLVRQPPPLTREMRPVPTSTAAAASLDEKIKSLEEHLKERQKEAARSGAGAPAATPTPMEITLTEQEISSKVNELLNRQAQQTVTQTQAAGTGTPQPAPAGGVLIRDVQLNFQEDQTVRGSATWDYQNFSGQVAGELEAKVEDGRLNADLKTIQVGGAGVPDVVVDQVRSSIQKYVGRVQIPDWVQDVKVTSDGQVTVKVK
ncbi:MAG: hypothetical protein M1531_11165 [Chloroflexi bacterium]|nr:hypothetical protein [Chloroflexota bacterium]